MMKVVNTLFDASFFLLIRLVDFIAAAQQASVASSHVVDPAATFGRRVMAGRPRTAAVRPLL
jgi:hypothetical protein